MQISPMTIFSNNEKFNYDNFFCLEYYLQVLFILYQAELWDGPKTSVKAAVDHYGFDRAFQMSEFDGFIRGFSRLTKKVKVWCEEKQLVDKLLHPKYGFELDTTESPKVFR